MTVSDPPPSSTKITKSGTLFKSVFTPRFSTLRCHSFFERYKLPAMQRKAGFYTQIDRQE
jgi:hypothetical protein